MDPQATEQRRKGRATTGSAFNEHAAKQAAARAAEAIFFTDDTRTVLRYGALGQQELRWYGLTMRDNLSNKVAAAAEDLVTRLESLPPVINTEGNPVPRAVRHWAPSKEVEVWSDRYKKVTKQQQPYIDAHPESGANLLVELIMDDVAYQTIKSHPRVISFAAVSSHPVKRDGRAVGEPKNAPLQIDIPKPLPQSFLDAVMEWIETPPEPLDVAALEAAAKASEAEAAAQAAPTPDSRNASRSRWDSDPNRSSREPATRRPNDKTSDNRRTVEKGRSAEQREPRDARGQSRSDRMPRGEDRVDRGAGAPTARRTSMRPDAAPARLPDSGLAGAWAIDDGPAGRAPAGQDTWYGGDFGASDGLWAPGGASDTTELAPSYGFQPEGLTGHGDARNVPAARAIGGRSGGDNYRARPRGDNTGGFAPRTASAGSDYGRGRAGGRGGRSGAVGWDGYGREERGWEGRGRGSEGRGRGWEERGRGGEGRGRGRAAADDAGWAPRGLDAGRSARQGAAGPGGPRQPPAFERERPARDSAWTGAAAGGNDFDDLETSEWTNMWDFALPEANLPAQRGPSDLSGQPGWAELLGEDSFAARMPPAAPKKGGAPPPAADSFLLDDVFDDDDDDDGDFGGLDGVRGFSDLGAWRPEAQRDSRGRGGAKAGPGRGGARAEASRSGPRAPQQSGPGQQSQRGRSPLDGFGSFGLDDDDAFGGGWADAGALDAGISRSWEREALNAGPDAWGDAGRSRRPAAQQPSPRRDQPGSTPLSDGFGDDLAWADEFENFDVPGGSAEGGGARGSGSAPGRRGADAGRTADRGGKKKGGSDGAAARGGADSAAVVFDEWQYDANAWNSYEPKAIDKGTSSW